MAHTYTPNNLMKLVGAISEVPDLHYCEGIFTNKPLTLELDLPPSSNLGKMKS